MLPCENNRAFIGIWSGRHATPELRCRANNAKQPPHRLLLDTSPSAATSLRRADALVPTARYLALPSPAPTAPVPSGRGRRLCPWSLRGFTSTKQCIATCPPAAALTPRPLHRHHHYVHKQTGGSSSALWSPVPGDGTLVWYTEVLMYPRRRVSVPPLPHPGSASKEQVSISR